MEGSEPDDNEPTLLLQQKNKTEKQSKSANEMTTENTSTDPRSWFQGLSGEDKSISISLTEKKFIGMFLQAVDAYCPHDDDDGQDDGTLSTATLNIMKKVRAKDLDDIYSSHEHGSTSESVETICKSSEAANAHLQTVDHSVDVDAPSSAPILVTASTIIEEANSKEHTNGDVTDSIENELSSPKFAQTETEAENNVLRIQEKSENAAITCTDGKCDDIGPESPAEIDVATTTLHFVSGLTVNISTKSDLGKKVAANVAQPQEKEHASVRHFLSGASSISNSNPGNSDEVHQHINFGALKAAPTSKEEAKRTNAQRIAEAKQSAARAIMASSNLAASKRLVKNLRFALSSARDFSGGINNMEHFSPSQDARPQPDEDSDDIILTFDPSYLSEQSGMQFLSDVENVIDSELRKVSTTGTGIKCKFLSNSYRIQEEKGAESSEQSHWLSPFLQSPQSEVSMVLILLARIEQSVLQAYRLDNQRQHNTKAQDTSISRESLQCLHSMLPRKDKSFLYDVFKSQRRLKERGLIDNHVDVPMLQIETMRIQDLILVPAQQISLAGSSSATPAQGFDDSSLGSLISKWNSVIDSANKLVGQSLKQPHLAIDNEVVELFADDTTVKKKVSKKKKKKNKKKRKNDNLKNAASAESDGKATEAKMSRKPIREDESSKSQPRNDCSASIVSIVSVASLSSKNKSGSENNNAEMSTEIVSEVNVDVTIPEVNAIPNVVNTHRVKELSQDNTDDGWETVESKKGKEKKSASSGKGAGGRANHANSQNASGSSRKNKGKSKNRNRNRQKEKEQAKANLDSLERGIAKRGANTTKALMEERNRGQATNNNHKNYNLRPATTSAPVNKSSTIKDAVMNNLPTRLQSGESLHTGSLSKITGQTNASIRFRREDTIKSSLNNKKGLSVDQNTASTVQETVSATSRSFPHVDQASKLATKKIKSGPKCSNDAARNAATEMKGNSSGSSTLDGTNRSRTPSTRKSSAPPLQTLVGPGNLNSADSSVASSLEAPHARYCSHKHNSSKEDDIGYHLLKVCERLSDDMCAFMTRRALALSSRRRERGALLASLQVTVQNIWVRGCHVEMYGSCATQLDLPASDLDVVVCGLDHAEGSKSRTQSFADDMSDTSSVSPASIHSEANACANQFYPSLSINGTRVLRLAAELERVPWAVQVKAIPTASVPVIKILADPSRLPGAAGMDWMLHHQQMAVAAVAAAEMNSGKMPVHQHNKQNCESCLSSSPSTERVSNMNTSNTSMNHHHIAAMSGLNPNPPVSFHSATPPWRGADIMNGLLSLDITFEGPEHGGLGSTAFSARVVQDACNESGLPPESTPAVQVLMVIKELLAQRRLNEPFSGGLSSYAILLLLVAVIKERRIISKEIERVERQREAVEMSTVDNEESPREPKSVVWPAEKHTKKQKPRIDQHGEKLSEKRNKSSWASIAMKPSSKYSKDTSQEDCDGDDASSKKANQATVHHPVKSDLPTTSKPLQNNDPEYNINDSTLFPQGSNDVLEVLCSGEPTAGKLLMHFLLFYGRHFDANTTCIDVSGTHHPDYNMKQHSTMHSNLELSPFTARKAGGTYNPVTDVYTVDPLIVFDPLEGAESNNVARSCYAWTNIRWTFEQCYNTLSGVVELGVGSNSNRSRSKTWPQQEHYDLPVDTMDLLRQVDELSPLLELLLSF